MCPDCDKYRKQKDNYCRVCGEELMKGYAKYAETIRPRSPKEKFCGFCGRPLKNGRCDHR